MSTISSKAKPQLTPFLRQYYAIKDQHPDKIVFFRMGDFYEMFGDDAIAAAPILGVTLTSRGQAGADPLPLAGVPYHAAEKYLAKLLSAGRKVVVVEQVEDPKTAKGVVRREVVEILTPGSAGLEALEEPSSPTYLAAVNIDDSGSAGVAYLDLSTAEFCLYDGSQMEALDYLATISPREILSAETSEQSPSLSRLLSLSGPASHSQVEPYHFSPTNGWQTLLDFFAVRTLEGFGVPRATLAVGAAAAIINYLRSNKRQELGHIRKISPVSSGQRLIIDSSSIRNLELVSSLSADFSSPTLFDVINHCLSAPGARRLRRNLISPFGSLEPIVRRQQALSEAREETQVAEPVRQALRELPDIERLAGRLGVRRLSPRQAQSLLRGLISGFEIVSNLKEMRAALLVEASKNFPDMRQFAQSMVSRLAETPPVSSTQGGIFADGSCAELDELKDSISDAKKYMACLQETERQATGIPSLKVGFNKVFGYYLEITHTHTDRVPESYIRKQTLVNAERYITEEMKVHERVILAAEEKIHQLETELFVTFVEDLAEKMPDIQLSSEILSEIDVIFALAELSLERGYVRPALKEDTNLEINNSRHPVIETLLPPGSFVPNDVTLNPDKDSLMILTGPNMAGKSTYLRQIGHVVILAHIGSYVPADSATVGLVDRVFTRVGAVDRLAQGHSTFMVEMLETANILNNASSRSLILLDEIGRGTSTFDGLSIAWAVVEDIHDRLHARTIFATHYHELTALAQILSGVANYQVSVKRWQDNIVFLHKIIPGGCDDSYGIEVARLAGLPSAVINRAREALGSLEGQSIQLIPNHSDAESKAQMTLFDVCPNPLYERIVKSLQNLDINNLTPLEAQRRLAQLCEEALDEK